MRFSSTLVLALSALNYLVSAQGTITSSGSAPTSTAAATGNQNPISYPLGGTLTAGAPTTITWEATYGNVVDLVLRQGKQTDLDKVETIASGIPNSGAFVWTIPKDLVAGDGYSIQIISGPESNYSPQFSINSDVTSSSTSSNTRTSTSTPVSTTISMSSATTTPASTVSTSAITSDIHSSNSSSTTMSTSTMSSPSVTASPAPGGATSINAGTHLSSPLALVFCIIAGLVYLN